MGSRYAVNRLMKAAERYAPGKIEFTFSLFEHEVLLCGQ